MSTSTQPNPLNPPAVNPAWAELRLASDVPPKVGVEADARLYWIGTLPGCPKQNVVLGGTCFPAFSEILEDTGYVTQRHKRSGAMVWLTPARVQRIREAVEDRVVRQLTTGNEALEIPPVRAVYSKRGQPDKPYAPFVGDEPLGRYLYLVDVESGAKKMGPLWREEAPAPLVA